jgi:hypothetical protein
MSDLAKSDLKHRHSKRCPVCFSREMDVLLISRGGDRWGCVKCAFTGSSSEVRAMYKDVQKKYHGMAERFTLEEQRKM